MSISDVIQTLLVLSVLPLMAWVISILKGAEQDGRAMRQAGERDPYGSL